MALTAKDAAQRAGVTKRTLLRWIREGQLKAERIETSTGPGYAVDEGDLDRLVAERADQAEKAARSPGEGRQGSDAAPRADDRLDALSEALRALQDQLAAKDAQIAEKDRQIERLHDQLGAKDRQIEAAQVLTARAQDHARQALPEKASRPWWRFRR